jgi:uncharacterized protein YndB with AHSA1/START domain
MPTETDRIRKRVVLRAPVPRVWSAISDSSKFGAWFGARFEGPFVAGKAAKGQIAPTTVDPEVARLQESHAGHPLELLVERVEPMRLFSFRWHPYAVDKTADFSNEPTTLVSFELSEVPGGTELVITESGFDALPASRRAKAFEMNDGGWTHQARLIEKYLANGG